MHCKKLSCPTDLRTEKGFREAALYGVDAGLCASGYALRKVFYTSNAILAQTVLQSSYKNEEKHMKKLDILNVPRPPFVGFFVCLGNAVLSIEKRALL